ncbi:MAG: hypothetical protein MRY49_03090 [Candidatus Pacebacteria bacterium]|nr:hypothetical protein [Candidatus Paceibacterota bacterium]
MKLGNITKSIKGILKKGGHSFSKKDLYNPKRDWKVIILSFCVLLVLTIVVHTTTYLLAEKGVIFNKDVEKEVFDTTLRRGSLDRTIDEYESRRANLDSLNTGVVLQDPAI